MLKALVLKELREIAAIGLIALAVLGYLVALSIGYKLPRWLPAGAEIPFVSDPFIYVAAMISFCLAAALGLAQSMLETARGTWMWLWHRPARRERIIAAKLGVGTMTYLLCAALPILWYALWAATPATHKSPFLWAMTYDAWANCLSMLVIYLGGFLTGVWPGRWFGTRLLPLVGVGTLLYALRFIFERYWPQWWLAEWTSIGLLAAAAHQTIDLFPGDLMRTRSAQPPRFLLALFLAFGIAPVWAIGVGMVMENVTPTVFGRGVQEYLLVRADGTAIINRKTYSADRHAVDTYRTSDGRPTAIDAADSLDPKRWLESRRLASAADMPEFPHLLNNWRWRVTLFQGRDEQADWYLVRDNKLDGHAYFAGYHRTTYECLGYLGRAGLSAVVPPLSEQFPIDSRSVGGLGGGQMVGRSIDSHWDPMALGQTSANLPLSSLYLLSDERLWRVDLRQHNVEALAAFPGALNLSLAPAPPGFEWVGENRADERLLVRTNDELLLTDFSGKTVERWTLPAEARSRNLDFYDLSEGAALINVNLLRAVGDRWEHELVWLDAPDTITRRERVEIMQGGIDSDEVWTFAPALPMPAVLTAFFAASASEVRGQGYQSTIGKAFVLFWPALLTVYLLSAGLAWLAYRRQRRFQLPAADGWAAFVFLFGVPGWLAHRWHRRWPVMARCDECHQAVPHDREACVACGAPFAPAPPTGAEVFA